MQKYKKIRTEPNLSVRIINGEGNYSGCGMACFCYSITFSMVLPAATTYMPFARVTVVVESVAVAE